MDLIGQNGNSGEHYARTSQNGLQDYLETKLMNGSGWIAMQACRAKEGQS
jgi:hypothetical protein